MRNENNCIFEAVGFDLHYIVSKKEEEQLEKL